MRTDKETGLPMYLPENAFTATLPITGGAAAGGKAMGRQFMRESAKNIAPNVGRLRAMGVTIRSPLKTHLRIAGKGLGGTVLGGLIGLGMGVGIDTLRRNSRKDYAAKLLSQGDASEEGYKAMRQKLGAASRHRGYVQMMQKLGLDLNSDELVGTTLGGVLGGEAGSLAGRALFGKGLRGALVGGALGLAAGPTLLRAVRKQFAEKAPSPQGYSAPLYQYWPPGEGR